MLSRVVSIDLTEMLKSGQMFEGGEIRKISMIYVGRAFYEKGRDTTQVLRWECTWHVRGTARRPVQLEQYEHGGVEK